MYIQYVYMYYLAPFQKVAENGRDLLRVTLLHELDACHYKLSMFVTVVKAMFPTYIHVYTCIVSRKKCIIKSGEERLV